MLCYSMLCMASIAFVCGMYVWHGMVLRIGSMASLVSMHVWHPMICYAMVWCGAVWCGIYGMMRYVWYGMDGMVWMG